MIKEYFANYFLHMSDVTFDMAHNTMEVHQKNAEPWRVTLVDTGETSMTGGRLKRIAGYVEGDDAFCCTYGDAVAVREAETLLVGDVVADAAQAAAGHRFLARVDQRHAPRLGVLLVHFHPVVRHVEGDVGHVQEVVGEVLLDHVALVAAADPDVVDAAGRVDLEDVPEERPAASPTS